MLLTIFGKSKPTTESIKNQPRALKIIHAGGHTEHYYMAIPASMIIEKHHSFVLARPEIFRRPWESVVRPNEILTPGQKYYLVPRRTIKKLRRRIRRPTTAPNANVSGIYSNAQDNASSVSGILVKPGRKTKARGMHVRFEMDYVSSSVSDKKLRNWKDRPTKPGSIFEEARNENEWEPSLVSINE